MEQRVHRRLQSRLHHLSARSDPTQSVYPASSPHHLLSVSSPSAPAAESNCPTTSDSRSCTGSLSGPFKIRHRLLVDPCAPWFAFTRLYASQTSHLEIQTALPHSSAPPIPGWLIEFGSITHVSAGAKIPIVPIEKSPAPRAAQEPDKQKQQIRIRECAFHQCGRMPPRLHLRRSLPWWSSRCFRGFSLTPSHRFCIPGLGRCHHNCEADKGRVSGVSAFMQRDQPADHTHSSAAARAASAIKNVSEVLPDLPSRCTESVPSSSESSAASHRVPCLVLSREREPIGLD